MQTLVRVCIVRQARMGQSQIVLHPNDTLITEITSPIALVQRCGREGQALSRVFASLSPHFLVVSQKASGLTEDSRKIPQKRALCVKNQHKSERPCEPSGNIPGNYLLSLPWVLTFLLESLRFYLDKRLLAFWLCVIGS